MFTPLHCAVRSRNRQAVVEFLSLAKKFGHFTDRIITIKAGYDELPLIHLLGAIMKGYETNYILHNHPEIDVFARDTRGTPAVLFEYFANNNFDNHRRWVLFKHQKKIYFQKFQKSLRSYDKIVKAELEYVKSCRCLHKLPESKYHSYTDVLKVLKQNNSRDMNKRWKLKQKRLKQVDNSRKLNQVEISPEHNLMSDETIIDYDGKMNSSFTPESDETTAAESTTINNLLCHMVMNPKRKREIDHTFSQGKSENITTEEDPLDQEAHVKGINFFSKQS